MTINTEVLRHIAQIRDDTTHGASELTRLALNTFILLADNSPAVYTSQLWQEIRETADGLKSARPAMASLKNSVNLLLRALPSSSAADTPGLRHILKTRAAELLDSSIQAAALIAGYTAGLVSDHDVIMTYSYSSTVSTALKAAHEKHSIKVIVARSGAGRAGIRTAAELNRSGLDITFIDDAAMGLYVSRVNRVLVGADRVCSDGGLVNGAGTYLLALAAEKAGKPFYVLCETLKFDPDASSSQVELEEKDPAEVVGPGVLNSQISVKNPYFDITPLDLISGFITEKGLMQSREISLFISGQA